MDPTKKDPAKHLPKVRTHKAGEPVEFIIGAFVGDVPPCPGSKKLPCSKCGEEVYLALSGQDIVKKGAKPICMDCARPALDSDDEIAIPELNTILADLLGSRKQ